MRRTLIAALLLAACNKPDVSELRADNKELRSELREIREELREIRAEQRDLRKLVGGDLPSGEPDAGPTTTVDAAAPELPATDGGAPKQADVKIVIESNPRGAMVWHEDRRLGKTPLLYEHPPGTKSLIFRIEKPGYRPRLLSIRPDEDAKLSVQLAPAPKQQKKKTP